MSDTPTPDTPQPLTPELLAALGISREDVLERMAEMALASSEFRDGEYAGVVSNLVSKTVAARISSHIEEEIGGFIDSNLSDVLGKMRFRKIDTWGDSRGEGMGLHQYIETVVKESLSQKRSNSRVPHLQGILDQAIGKELKEQLRGLIGDQQRYIEEIVGAIRGALYHNVDKAVQNAHREVVRKSKTYGERS